MRGSRALVIRPRVAEPSPVPGLLSCVWLNALKNSARYCNRQRSVNRKFLIAERSILNVLGPGRIFRPELPKVPMAAGANASVVYHFRMRSALEPLVSEGWPFTSAVSLPTPLSARSSLEVMVSGKPLCQFHYLPLNKLAAPAVL